MVIKNGIRPPNLHGDSAHRSACSGDPVVGRFSCTETPDQAFDNMVFDTEEFTLSWDGQYASRPDGPLHPGPPQPVHEQTAAVQRPQVSRWAHMIHALAELKSAFSVRRPGMWTTATIVLSLAVTGIVLYAAWSDGYRLETKLLLLDRDQYTSNAAGRTLEDEVEILKSPHILHLLSRDLFERGPETLAQGGHLQMVGNGSLKETFEVRQRGRTRKMACQKDMS